MGARNGSSNFRFCDLETGYIYFIYIRDQALPVLVLSLPMRLSITDEAKSLGRDSYSTVTRFLCCRKNFAKTVSALLNIPEWRLFYIRTEQNKVQGCITVKFGIIGNG